MIGNNGTTSGRGPAAPAGMPPLPTAPGALPGQPPRDVAVIIELSQPLPGHDREYWQIELRKPTFGDWLECGDIHETVIHDPKGMQLGDGGAVQVKINHDAVAKWFTRLSGLSFASISKLSMPDSRKVLREVVAMVGSIDSGN